MFSAEHQRATDVGEKYKSSDSTHAHTHACLLARTHARSARRHARARAHEKRTTQYRKVERARRAMGSPRLWDTGSHQGARAQEIHIQGFEASGASNIVHKVGGVGQNSQQRAKTSRSVLCNFPHMQFECRARATRGNGDGLTRAHWPGQTASPSVGRSYCQSISRQVGQSAKHIFVSEACSHSEHMDTHEVKVREMGIV